MSRNKIYKPEEVTCKICGRISKSPWGAKKHFDTKHTEAGAAKMKEAALRGAKVRKARELGAGVLNEQPAKRPYKKRVLENDDSFVKFCPQCGCNIQAVKIAMNFKP
jgi:hypothetical protein